jgi:hypothetical protein
MHLLTLVHYLQLRSTTYVSGSRGEANSAVAINQQARDMSIVISDCVGHSVPGL